MGRLTFLPFVVLFSVAGASVAAGLDPSNVGSMTSPSANLYWQPDKSLPVVTRPDKAPSVPTQFTGPLSLAELTDAAGMVVRKGGGVGSRDRKRRRLADYYGSSNSSYWSGDFCY